MEKFLKYRWLFVFFIFNLFIFSWILKKQASFRFEKNPRNTLLNRTLLSLENIENFIYDLKFKDHPARARVAVAKIDDSSLLKFGRWPWSRQVYKKLLEELYQKGARVVAFDAVFSEPEWNRDDLKRNLSVPLPGKSVSLEQELGLGADRVEKLSENLSEVGDRFFSDALQKYPQTVLGYVWLEQDNCLEQQRQSPNSLIDPILSIQTQATISELPSFKQDTKTKAHLMSCVVSNRSSLAAGARRQGFFNFVPDRDGIFRRYPGVFLWATDFLPKEDLDFLNPELIQQGSYFASLGMQALASYWDAQIKVISSQDNAGELIIKEIVLEKDKKELISFSTHPDASISLGYYGPQNIDNPPIYDFSLTQIPDDLKDYIVFIGPTSLGVYDLRPSPVQKDMRGVYLHATLASQALEFAASDKEDFISFSNFNQELIHLFIFTLILFLIICYVPMGTAITSSVVVVGIQIFYDVWIFQNRHTSYPTATLAIASFVIISMGLLYRYITEEREKTFVKGAFEKYVSPKLVKTIMKDPQNLSLGGEKRHMTVLFTDVRSFTSISEKLSASELSKFLNDYLSPMSDIILKFDGTIDKYMGDAIMALFGAPIYFEDHAKKAVDSALDMISELEKLNEVWSKIGLPKIETGIGINTGDMSVGNMGSKKIFSYTVMGDAVNLASRIEGITKEYHARLLISEFTFKELPKEYACRKIDKVRVKGKEEPVTLFEVLAKNRNQDLNQQIQIFEESLELYQKMDFQKALEGFSKLSAQDPVSAVFAQRCELFDKAPPPYDWDGTWTMLTK
ncbi:MAG: adenylate/guanylate cyclase domain-containing protein [Proteobacteria bacterium]|nr:adenylate/guanylate cyclase domain-containing protein [Pseudomonadota bacterium]